MLNTARAVTAARHFPSFEKASRRHVVKHLFLALLMTFCMFSGAQAAQLNKVAAVVNGKVITMYDLQKNALPDLIRARVRPDDPKQAKEMDRILRNTLDGMIMDILFEQEAVRLKATVSESDVDEELATIMKTNGLTKAQFEQRLAGQKISLRELRDNLRKKIMRQKIMGQEVGRKVVVTNREIEDYYRLHKNDLFRRDGLHMALLVYPRNVNAASIAAQIASGALSFPAAAPAARDDGVLPPGQHKIVITATETCWIRSTADRTDTRQFSLGKGDTFALTFSQRLDLRLGNAGGVRIRYDGKDFPTGARSGQARTLVFPPKN